jgi:hypothetical protein
LNYGETKTDWKQTNKQADREREREECLKLPNLT